MRVCVLLFLRAVITAVLFQLAERHGDCRETQA